MLLGGVVLAWAGTRALQVVQTRFFHVLPFGALTDFKIVDTCVGTMVSGSFMLYFGACTLAIRQFCSACRMPTSYWKECGVTPAFICAQSY
jgi:hypothetical protein